MKVGKFLVSACAALLASCGPAPAADGDLASATDAFSKAIDSADTMTQKQLSGYRRQRRLEALMAQNNLALAQFGTQNNGIWQKALGESGSTPGEALLCAGQATYFDTAANWAIVKNLKQPFEKLSATPTQTGVGLFFYSVTNHYAPKPGDPPPKSQGQSMQAACMADIQQETTNLNNGDMPTGVQEAAGLAIFDAVVAAAKAIDGFFGALGSLVDDKRRESALRVYILNQDTQDQFDKNVAILKAFSDKKNDNDRAYAAQSYAAQHLKYRAVYDSVVAQDLKAAPSKAAPQIKDKAQADKAARSDQVIKISGDLEKQVAPEVTALLNAADAYDAALELKAADPYQSLRDAFAKLTKAARDKDSSFASIMADAKTLQGIFQNGSDAIDKTKAAIEAIKGTATPAK